MRTVKCDACGTEIDGIGGAAPYITLDRESCDVETAGPPRNYDLCINCFEKIEKAVEKEINADKH